MDNDLLEVQQILERNDYRVELTATAGGCTAKFPTRVEVPLSPCAKHQYEYVENGLRATLINEDGIIYSDRIYKCPTYSQRLLMFSHIISKCLSIDFAVALINFIYDNQSVNEDVFYHICSSKYMTEQDTLLEMELKPIIIQGIFSGFTTLHEMTAKTTKTLEGYLCIRNLLTGKSEENNES